MTPEEIRALIQQVQNDTLYEGRYTEEDRLVEAVEKLVKVELERVRQGTLLEAAKVICENCEHGWTATLALNEYYHPIPLKGPQLCEASEIYKLMAQRQGGKGSVQTRFL